MNVDIATIDFTSVFSQFHEGVLITDKTGVIVYYNKAMGKIDDLDAEYAIGKKIIEVYDLTLEQSPTMECLASQEAVFNKTLFYRTHLGKVTNGFLNVYPLFKDNELVGALCLVTEYHMVEKKLLTAQPTTFYEPESKNGTRYSFINIIGRRGDLAECVKNAHMAAQSPSPVLIVGETGTGKELFAQSIHNSSSSRSNKFVAINCAAIPENLLEGILFGTSKGAFTGSIEKAGLFEQANGGTLFLDELNSMPLTLQTKLLRVIQEKKVRRLGSHREVNLRLKIITSMNRDPLGEINQGKLREDLFYRLGVVFIQIPALRDRPNDLEKLINHFIQKFNSRLNKNVSGISQQVHDFFTHYHWPGNVRELEHVIEGAMNLVGTDEIIEKSHLPHHILRSIFAGDGKGGNAQLPSSSFTPHDSELKDAELCKEVFSKQDSLHQLHEAYRSAEKMIIKKALVASKGNVAQAVKKLGFSSPQALQYKMKKLKINRTDFLDNRS